MVTGEGGRIVKLVSSLSSPLAQNQSLRSDSITKASQRKSRSQSRTKTQWYNSVKITLPHQHPIQSAPDRTEPRNAIHAMPSTQFPPPACIHSHPHHPRILNPDPAPPPPPFLPPCTPQRVEGEEGWPGPDRKELKKKREKKKNTKPDKKQSGRREREEERRTCV